MADEQRRFLCIICSKRFTGVEAAVLHTQVKPSHSVSELIPFTAAPAETFRSSSLAEIAAMHHEKHGIDNNDQPYVICDYDKTDWPCRTHRILETAKRGTR